MTGALQHTPPLLAALAAVLACAVAWDLATARIPNWLTFPAAAAALAWHAALAGGEGARASAAGWLLGIGLLLVPWLLGGLGAGDAKLMGAVGAFLGPQGCFSAFLGTALVGGVAALALLAWQRALGSACRRWLRMGTLLGLGQAGYEEPSAAEQAPRLRYGLAIALGTLGVLLLGERLPGPLSLPFSF
jgi:prepilin peptidase CpaA